MSLFLPALVAAALAVEGVTGFGATVLTVALASFVMPVHTLLPAYVPVNLLLSASIVVRDRARVDRALLTRGILPAMLLGMPFGFGAFVLLGDHAGVIERGFGGLIAVLAAIRLSGRAAPERWRTGILWAAGVVHGAFGTGGPLVVYALAGTRLDKSVFRATLSALWLVLSGCLFVGYVVDHRVGADSLRLSLSLLPGLAVGLGVGQVLHGRLPQAAFVRAVDVLLGIAGLILAFRH